MQEKHVGGSTVKNLAHKQQTCLAQNLPNSMLYFRMLKLMKFTWKTCYKLARFMLVFVTIFTLTVAVSCTESAKYVGFTRFASALTENEDSNNNSDLKSKSQTTYEDKFSKGIELSIIKATPIVTDQSGYHLTATLKATGEPLPEGMVQVAINSNYTFASRTDLQHWAQNESLIPTPQILGSVKTDGLSAGSSSTFNFDIPADSPELKSIWNWGPKPLKITYFSNDYSRYKSIRSFLTRTNDGLHVANSPAMNITAVMPMLSNTQYALKPNLIQPVRHSATLLQSTKNDTHHVLEQADLVSKHEKLQTIADINTLQAARLLFRPSAYMQQSGFDISAYADDHNPEKYRLAGIPKSTWSAKNSQIPQVAQSSQSAQAAQAIQDSKSSSKENNVKQVASTQSSSLKAYAWQTHGKWTIEALEQAKLNGYNTVIATDEFYSKASQFALSDGVYDIETPSGKVRVLSPQAVLTTLANGSPTSDKATCEKTQAGRINRLIAQSAFYQMEQPYVDRHILVTFSNKTPIATIDATMNALEKSPWLSLSDLSTLNQLKQNELPRWKLNSIIREMPHNSGISASATKLRHSTLKNLLRSRKDILRFTNNILDYNAAAQFSSNEGDAQALAKQTAKSKTKINAKAWGNYLLKMYDSIALHDFTNEISKKNAKKHTNNCKQADSCIETNTSQNFARSILSKIHIIPPRDITAVSETASMPITISNIHPYPVQVYLSANTNAMEIVTRRKTLVKIPANSETQVTLPLRITTSIRTKATFMLEDTEHNGFSKPQYTIITSTLQISDKSGTIIIIFAFMLGLLGLWRQFNRKKDPDE